MADAADAPAAVPEVAAAPAVDGALAPAVANGHAEPTGSSNANTDSEKPVAAANGPDSAAEQDTADKPDGADKPEDNQDTDKRPGDVAKQEAGASLGAGDEPPKAEVDSTPAAAAQVDANTSIANEPAVMDSTKKDVAAAEDTAPAAPTTAADDAKPADTTPAPAAAAAAADDAKKADVDGDAAAGDADAATETRADGAEDADKKKDDAPTAADDAADKEAAPGAGAAPTTPAKPAKTAAAIARRKSLNRKGSKARIVHLDAKPGDHYFVKLKGYPAWPVIICDEDMLPQTLIKSRPVTAARQDGTYREDYADGGKRAADRTFPVMYLYTNEFGWVPNQDLHDLDPSKVLDAITDKMRKDLQEAHRIAAENNPLSFFKDMLRQFQEDLERAEEDARLAAEAKKAAKKAKEADVDMLDVPADDDELSAAPAKKTSKKRKADEDAQTPQRSNSVKKPKIKITSSGTPKSGTTAAAKSSKSDKASKPKAKSSKGEEAKAAAPREPELSPEERIKRKSKEVLFLRHKIQKGLLTNNVEPKPEEMKLLSDYLTKLEGFPNLEVDVIRGTKIHKVLKAILKIPFIPREDEFTFKPRSKVLLEKWNKRLAAEPAPPEDPEKKAHGEANGVTNGHAEKKEANGVKADGVKAEPAAAAEEAKEPAAVEAAA